MDAEVPTVRVGATPTGLMVPPTPQPPRFFTGRITFLPPNQQRQSTEGNTMKPKINITITMQQTYQLRYFDSNFLPWQPAKEALNKLLLTKVCDREQNIKGKNLLVV